MANVAAVRSNREWTSRKLAAEKYRPKTIRLLLIAEAPPEDLSRYFYFEDASSSDSLFHGVSEVLFEEPESREKDRSLKELRRRGVFLIELRPDAPIGNAKPADYVDWLLLRMDELQPEQILLIGAPTHEAAYKKLAAAKRPVSDVRVPFPTSGREADFRRELRKALVRAGLEKLIRPLPSGAKKTSASR